MGRGQIAVEFMMMVMLAFVFLVTVLIIVGFYTERAAVQKRQALLEEQAAAIQQELLLAAGAMDGYQRNFTLPSEIGGNYYTVTNAQRTLTIAIGNETILNKPIPPVSGTITKGTNRIRRMAGQIVID